MTEEELIDALAEAVPLDTGVSDHAIACALLPVIRAHADQRAAEELRRMADWIDGEAGPACEGLFWPALGLRNRADTLTAS